MEHNVRKNQIMAPFGPGAIIEFDGNSFIVKTVDKWDPQNAIPLNEPRLANQLRKNRFLTPRSDKDANAFVKIRRFPSWHFCERPSCRKMTKVTATNANMSCLKCGGRLVPMRFIMVCANGHADDVPWHRWAHMDSRVLCKDYDNLYTYSTGESGGLDSIKIECKTCNAKKSLSGITSPDVADRLNIRCPGKQPWEFVPPGSHPLECDHKPLIVLRELRMSIFPCWPALLTFLLIQVMSIGWTR